MAMENELDTSLFTSNFHLDVEFSQLSLRKNNKDILSNISGTFRAGRLSAIMGSSGCGKTSLLSVLSGKVDKTSGSIRISGKDDTIQNYRKLVGFVPQDDVMHRSLTVKENILFAARTRLATDIDDADKAKLANEVIKLLGKENSEKILRMVGLNRVRHSIIGNEENRGVSGGERKRVNIGMELAAQPSVLFLDEVRIL
jgi:ABC-type multidrug transport system ATPase subunit